MASVVFLYKAMNDKCLSYSVTDKCIVYFY